MGFLTHIFNFAEVYAVALMWIAAPLFFVAVFQMLRKSGTLVIPEESPITHEPETISEEKVADGKS